MVIAQNKAELIFSDRESAEKFLKQYNRLGILKNLFFVFSFLLGIK